MDFSKEIVLSYLEEDNAARAYFRLIPLLARTGPCTDNETRYPDHGALRIVPDKNEQGYFKDRMRALGSFCAMDMTGFAPSANKIRTNKNYRPDGDEKNQYILYSDTVCAIPDGVFYEIIEGDPADAAAAAEMSITPAFYIKSGERFYGPVRRDAPQEAPAADGLPGKITELRCPDGKTRMIWCAAPLQEEEPEAELNEAMPEDPGETEEQDGMNEPAKDSVGTQDDEAEKSEQSKEPERTIECSELTELAEQIEKTEPAEPEIQGEAEQLPLGEKLAILDEQKTNDEVLRELNQPVSESANRLTQSRETGDDEDPEEFEEPVQLVGTPLTHAPGPALVPQHIRDRVQEAVHAKLRFAKCEGLGDTLPGGVRLTEVENPVECLTEAIRSQWEAYPEHRERIAEAILLQPGAGPLFSRLMAQMLDRPARG